MPQRYIDTTLFDLFKVGPGQSSSPTIGPMKAGLHFAVSCGALPRDLLVRAVRFRVRLYGALSTAPGWALVKYGRKFGWVSQDFLVLGR